MRVRGDKRVSSPTKQGEAIDAVAPETALTAPGGDSAPLPIEGMRRSSGDSSADDAPRHPSSEEGRGRRVLVVAPQPFYEDRGTPIAVRQLVEALAHLGYTVDILTYPLGDTIPMESVTYHRCRNPLRIRSVPIGFSARKVALDVTLILALRRQLRRQRYDVIHAVEEAAYAAVGLARGRHEKVIYDMQSDIPEQMANNGLFGIYPMPKLMRLFERWVLRNADSVMASAGLMERVLAAVPDARVREWYFASFPSGFTAEELKAARREMQLSDDDLAVVYSGNFAPYQGVNELLSALPIIRRTVPNARLVLIGANGAERSAIWQEISARRLSDHVTLVSRRPRAEIPRYVAAADVLVSPRLYGGNLPLKVFDYLAAGRPIVATDIPTHRTVLDEDLAEFAEPRAASIAQAVVRVLTDRRRAEFLAASGSRYATANLGWMTFVESVHELYSGVVTNGD